MEYFCLLNVNLVLNYGCKDNIFLKYKALNTDNQFFRKRLRKVYP